MEGKELLVHRCDGRKCVEGGYITGVRVENLEGEFLHDAFCLLS